MCWDAALHTRIQDQTEMLKQTSWSRRWVTPAHVLNQKELPCFSFNTFCNTWHPRMSWDPTTTCTLLGRDITSIWNHHEHPDARFIQWQQAEKYAAPAHLSARRTPLRNGWSHGISSCQTIRGRFYLHGMTNTDWGKRVKYLRDAHRVSRVQLLLHVSHHLEVFGCSVRKRKARQHVDTTRPLIDSRRLSQSWPSGQGQRGEVWHIPACILLKAGSGDTSFQAHRLTLVSVGIWVYVFSGCMPDGADCWKPMRTKHGRLHEASKL